jgi:hypothetical protein
MNLPSAEMLGSCFGLSEAALNCTLGEGYAAYSRRAKGLVPWVYRAWSERLDGENH